MVLGTPGPVFANARILRALDRSIPMRFRQEAPLRDVLAYVVTASRSPDGYEVPIYVGPGVPKGAGKTLESPVTINLEGVPLRTSLGLALDQLSLSYTVKGGVLIVNDDYDPLPVACDDTFLTIGHSLLALLAAGVGGALAAVTHDRRGETAAELLG